jgi:hypothetical protein
MDTERSAASPGGAATLLRAKRTYQDGTGSEGLIRPVALPAGTPPYPGGWRVDWKDEIA